MHFQWTIPNQDIFRSRYFDVNKLNFGLVLYEL